MDRPIASSANHIPKEPRVSIALPSTYRTVEVSARGHIEDPTAHGEEDRPAVHAVELEKRLRGVSAEYDRGRAARECDGLLGAEVPVQQHDEEGEEDEVDGGGD